jgi:Flp pilus assembly protein TadG
MAKQITKMPTDDRKRSALSIVGNLLRRYSRDRSGVTAIEFAAVGLPFFMLTLGLLEIGLAFFVNRVLDNATLESARLIRTGQAHQNGFDEVAFKKDVCSRLTAVLCNPEKLIVDVRKYSDFSSLDTVADDLITTDEDGNLKDTSSYQIGTANDIVVVRTVFRWPMFTSIIHADAGDTSNMERYLFSTVVFRNEPFPW